MSEPPIGDPPRSKRFSASSMVSLKLEFEWDPGESVCRYGVIGPWAVMAVDSEILARTFSTARIRLSSEVKFRSICLTWVNCDRMCSYS
jgi:hypothetical protein